MGFDTAMTVRAWCPWIFADLRIAMITIECQLGVGVAIVNICCTMGWIWLCLTCQGTEFHIYSPYAALLRYEIVMPVGDGGLLSPPFLFRYYWRAGFLGTVWNERRGFRH